MGRIFQVKGISAWIVGFRISGLGFRTFGVLGLVLIATQGSRCNSSRCSLLEAAPPAAPARPPSPVRPVFGFTV